MYQVEEQDAQQDEPPPDGPSWASPSLFSFPSLGPPNPSRRAYCPAQESSSAGGYSYPSLPSVLLQEQYEPQDNGLDLFSEFQASHNQTSECTYLSTEDTTSPSEGLWTESQCLSPEAKPLPDSPEMPHAREPSYTSSLYCDGKQLVRSPELIKPEIPPSKASVFVCSICSRVCDSSKSLRQHKRCHTKSNTCPVPVCEARFTTKRDLERHKLAVHQKGGEKHPCTGCGTKFTREDNLLRHKKDKCPRRSVDDKELFSD